MSGWDWAIPFVKDCLTIFFKWFIGGSISVGGLVLLAYISCGVHGWFESINRQMR